jgi:magnesium transporter
MLRTMNYDGTLQVDLPTSAIPALLEQPDMLLWVDIHGDPTDDEVALLRETFGFHPLAIDDALEEAHVPKIDDWAAYLYLVVHAVHCEAEQCDQVSTQELDIFLGPNYLITYQVTPLPTVDRVWETCQRDSRVLHRGPAHLLYRLVDDLIAEYLPLIDRLDNAIDAAEDEVFDTPEADLLERIFALKRTLLRLRRILGPQREVLNKLARGDFPVLPEKEEVYFRDIYDHLVRIYDITDGLRDLVGGVLDTYLSVVNNRMNEVMKMLTIITTLFMPLSFLVGFFGMNFFEASAAFPAWTSTTALVTLLVLMVILPVGMYLWMQRRHLL